MNATTLKALALDSLYQVLDNKVFRILLVLVIVPVLGTFLFGFREDEIVFLFGVASWGYEGLTEFFAAMLGTRFGLEDPQTLVINGFSTLIVEGLAGSLGVMFTIAAASFFVPQMIEKGAADVVFHKPVPRLVLFLSRYFGGLAFIAMFALALVGGMYLGFLLVSGYNDPGMLWAALTLSYVFALMHGVSMLIGVLTRSTVASILLTIVFFMVNGCNQNIWTQIEREKAAERAEAIADAAEEAPDESEEETEDEPDEPAIARILTTAVTVWHYAAPKTMDADYITQRLRAAVEGDDPYFDEESELIVLSLAGGLEAADANAAAPPVAGAEELLGEARFLAQSGERSFAIWRRERREVEREGRSRPYPESTRDAGRAFEELLEGLDPERERISVGEAFRMESTGPVFRRVRSERLKWSAAGRDHIAIFLVFGDFTNTLVFSAPPGDLDAPPEEVLLDEATEDDPELESSDEVEPEETWDQLALAETGILNSTRQGTWYGDQLGWDAPLKFNLFFSIGSSLLFALVMLLLGWWRLTKIDF